MNRQKPEAPSACFYGDCLNQDRAAEGSTAGLTTTFPLSHERISILYGACLVVSLAFVVKFLLDKSLLELFYPGNDALQFFIVRIFFRPFYYLIVDLLRLFHPSRLRIRVYHAEGALG